MNEKDFPSKTPINQAGTDVTTDVSAEPEVVTITPATLTQVAGMLDSVGTP